ncbi:MAG: ABC transporter permease [Phycisphaerales bacterium]|nr:ABC transporter permease [Phycisphaerales bacterium]
MRAASRLARSICSARPSRITLLSLAVAGSVILVTAIACAMASINAAFVEQLNTQVGTAEIRVQPRSGETMDDSVLGEVRRWDGVEHAVPRLTRTISLVATVTVFDTAEDRPLGYDSETTRLATSVFVYGIDPTQEIGSRPVRLLMGRDAVNANEIVIDARTAQRLSWAFVDAQRSGTPTSLITDQLGYIDRSPPEAAEHTDTLDQARKRNAGAGVRIGDTLVVPRLFGQAGKLVVVGIAESPPIGGKLIARTTLETLDSLGRKKNQLSDIEVHLKQGVDAEMFADEHADSLGDRLLVQTTERITSGVEKNMAATQLGFLLISVISLISAGFIITTGLTTGVAEQQRTLAVLRCVGAARRQLAGAQLLVGLVVAAFGSLIGVPIGILLAWTLSEIFKQQMPTGLVVPAGNIVIVVLGSVGAGLIGAMWPAWKAASSSPLEALSVRAVPHRTRSIVKIGLVGIFGIAVMAAIVVFFSNQPWFFWTYAAVGLPAMFVGYFLISVPIVVCVSIIFGPLISRMLALPGSLLNRTVRATPYRHGFTAGALMTGIALLIGIWTNGSAAMNDWLAKINFPDAFAYGMPLSEDAKQILDDLPFVDSTCMVTLHPVGTDAFGIEGLSKYKTSFIGFEPDSFFDMVTLEFVQGDEAAARRRLNEGGAVLVAREFLIARGMGVGDEFTCQDEEGQDHTFEIVGVVTSPGLELANQFFDLSDNLVHQSIHSVFGSRADLIKHFDIRTAQLIQVDLNDSVDDATAVQEMHKALLGAGVLNVGSGRQIREQIEVVFSSTLVVLSTVAIGAMGVACFGVANLIIAEVHARRYEMGVLRACGATRGQLVRLICGQALLIAITACVLGTLLGLQAAWGGRETNRQLAGIDLPTVWPIVPIAFSWIVAIVLAVASAGPSAARINRSTIRGLMSGG